MLTDISIPHKGIQSILLCCLVWLLLVICHTGVAQVSMVVSDTAAPPRSGSKILVAASIENNTATVREYKLRYSFQQLEAIGTPPASITVLPNEVKKILIQLYIPKKISADTTISLELYANTINDTKYKAMLPIKLLPERNIIIQVMEPRILLDSWQQLIQYEVRCYNAGNITSSVILQQNDYSQSSKIDRPVTLVLPPGKDTIIQLQKQNSSHAKTTSNYNFLFTAAFPQEDAFYTANISANILSSKKNYPQFTTMGNRHQIAAFSRFIGNPYQYYELNYNNDFSLKSVIMDLQANAYYYPTSNNKLMLTNSFVSMTAGNINLRLGTIQHGGENPLSGRGASLAIKGKNNTGWELGYLNGSYNLLERTHTNSLFKPVDLAFMQFEKVFSPFASIFTSASRLWNPQQATNANIIGTNFILLSNNMKHKIELSSHFSHSELGKKSGTQLLYDKLGVAGSINYEWNKKSWQLLSRNYISSKYYSGTRNGVKELDEQISYRLHQGSIWGKYTNLKNSPTYFYAVNQYGQSSYSKESLELGWSHQFRNQVVLTIKPYILKEHMTTAMIMGNNPQQHAARFQTKINIPLEHKALFYLNTEASYMLGSSTPFYKNSWGNKLMATYKLNWFSISLQAQQGPFYLNEMLMYQLVNKKYELYTLSPTITKALLQDKLRITVGSNMNYEKAFQRWSNNVTFNGQFEANKAFVFIANFNRQQFSFYKPTNMLDLGIIKRLPNKNIHQAVGKLTLFVYEDANSNAIFDAGDQIAANVIVQINNETFKTNSSGKLTYSGIPNGSYAVHVFSEKGYLQETAQVNVNGKTHEQFPLIKTARITGQIIVKKSALSFNTNDPISGIKVIATNKTGRTFEAQTDELGAFVLYAPPGEYSVHVIEESVAAVYELQTGSQKLIVSSIDPPKKLLFEMLIKVRKSKIIKFSSM